MTRYELSWGSLSDALLVLLIGGALAVGGPPLMTIVSMVAYVLYVLFGPGARPRVAMDEGGLRYDGPLGLWHRYLPLAEIGHVDLVGSNRLVIEARTGERLAAWPVRDCTTALALYADLMDRLEARQVCPASDFARAGRELGDWCAVLSSRLQGRSSPYRTGLDLEAAAELLRNADAPADARASAAFLLLSSGDAQGVSEARAAITPNAPPILIALAALAPTGAELRARARELVRYLDRPDRSRWLREARALGSSQPALRRAGPIAHGETS